MNRISVNTAVSYSAWALPSLSGGGVTILSGQDNHVSDVQIIQENFFQSKTLASRADYSEECSIFIQWQTVKQSLISMFEVNNIASILSFLKINQALVEVLYEARKNINNFYQQVSNVTLELHSDPEEDTQSLIIGITSTGDSVQAARNLVSLLKNWFIVKGTEITSKIVFTNQR